MYDGYQGYTAGYEPGKPERPDRYHMTPIDNLVLAQAYIPIQRYGKTFPPEEALKQGTLFPELVRPYTKRKQGGRW